MKVIGTFFCRLIALALGGDDMEQDGAASEVIDVLQGCDQGVQVVAGDWAYIAEFQGLKEHARGKEALKTAFAFFEDLENIFADVGEGFEKVFHLFTEFAHGGTGHLTAQKTGERPDVW